MNALLALVVILAPGADDDPVNQALNRPILGPRKTLAEVQDFVESRIPTMPKVASAAEWTDRAKGYRASVLKDVVFRGDAARWRALPTKPEFLGEIAGGPGYVIKKLRFEVVPGLWIPALMYVPTDLRGKVPVVLNVNGHDPKGKAADYKQIRCINQAKRGMIALNLEWYGMGQLKGAGFGHGLINAIDLCGTSGISLHYLAMTRGIDILLAHENADPTRVGVTGLSGGGWQTIFVSALDDRVTLTDPVAGYSTFRTRLRETSDLGDSEQTPNDLATIVDYAHLTAMMAPRPTLLTFNGKDDCCFAAGHALPPLREAAAPIFQLFGAEGNLRSHVNMDPGTHNYGLDNRQAFYQMMADHWSRPGYTINPVEIPSDAEVKTAEALNVDLPAENLDFRKLAELLAAKKPSFGRGKGFGESFEHLRAEDQARVRPLVRPIGGEVMARKVGESEAKGVKTTFWEIKIGTTWTVPAVEMTKGEPKGTTILIGDEGRAKLGARASGLLEAGERLIVVDLYGFGEAVPPSHVYLYGLLIDAVGERPLGVDCGQLTAVATWRRELDDKASTIVAVGPRSSAIALVANALDSRAFVKVKLHGSMKSLKEVISEGREYSASPELFCFGLLEQADLVSLRSMGPFRKVEIEGQ